LRKELRRWRRAVRPRGVEVVAWMRTQPGSILLSDDDAAAVAEYVRWIDAQTSSAWNVLFGLLSLGD
jgi:hypothetical protein